MLKLNSVQKQKIEFGDFQTPDSLAYNVCAKLSMLGISPDVIIEPTCGVGAFVIAAGAIFKKVSAIYGFEINESYVEILKTRLLEQPFGNKVKIETADFFNHDWKTTLEETTGNILVLGNFPWVTNTVQSVIGGINTPVKSNFLNHCGFDAISGKSNFDISEWMILEVLGWFHGRCGNLAMLMKTAVARKVLAYVETQNLPVFDACIFSIDAKKEFNASVDACLLVFKISKINASHSYDYQLFKSLSDINSVRIGNRNGLTVSDIDMFESSSFVFGASPQKWRSGVKHDASAVMEMTKTRDGLINGLGEILDIESDYLFPLCKGSDIGSGKGWRNKFVLITQKSVGERTDIIYRNAPKTWLYLEGHADKLDARGSVIYKKNPRFSMFGIGDYTFRPWKIAICGLYKSLQFRLIGPIDGKPVMFDDTVYYLSFDSESEAIEAYHLIISEPSMKLMSSLIFWDDKRPIKTSILNVVNWASSKLPVNFQLGKQQVLFS